MQREGDIVNNTSNGILLHGLIHIRNEEDETYCVVAPAKLLENVDDSQVNVSGMNDENSGYIVSCTQTESMRLQERVTRTRNVIGGSLGLSVVGFGGVEIGLKKGKIVTNLVKQKTTTSTNYLSLSKIFIRRKLSLQLRNDGPLHFSKAVYTSLGDIVKTYKRKEEYEKCRDFFMKYGSHVDLGECCLGGVAEILSECKGVKGTFEIRDNDEKNTENLIGVVVEGGFSFANGKIKVTPDVLKGKTELLVVKDNTDLQNYKVRANIYGGSCTASFPEWKKSLDEEKTDLHIIDRGCLKMKYVVDDSIAMDHKDLLNNHKAVWELLRSQQHKVASLETFNFAEAAWKTEVFYKTFLYRQRIIEIINGINKEPRAVKYLIALMKIFKVNEWRKNEVKNLDEWGQFIEDDDTFLNFVEKMDSLPDLYSDVFTKIKDTLRALMEQVEKQHENIQRVMDVKAMIDAKSKRITPKTLANRNRIETTILENRSTEDGDEYSRALKTILEDVEALKQETEDDSYWINMLRIDSVYKFLLKPKKYMIMTMQTFNEVISTITELTQEPARVAALPKNQEITSIVYNGNRELIEKIEFRANVRQCVDTARNITTAQDYQKALEDIRNEVNTTLRTPAARSKVLTELLQKDKGVAAFLQKAGNLKMNKKTLSDLSDIVLELLEYVDYFDPKRRDIEAVIVALIQK